MEQLKYSQNWNNKLDCKIHTTIRLRNPKYQKGLQVVEVLNGKQHNVSEIIDIQYGILEVIPRYILMLDTGLSAIETKEMIKTMYKNFTIKGNPIDFETQLFDVLFLKIVKKL